MQGLNDWQAPALRRIGQQVGADMRAAAEPTPAPAPAPHRPTAAVRASHASLARRQARYEEAAALHARGLSIRRIALQIGAERTTIRHWLSLGHAPLWHKPCRGSILDPHAAWLEQR